MTTIHVEVKFRNAPLLRALAERYPPGRQGYANIRQAAEEAKISLNRVYAWLRLKPCYSPYDKEGNANPAAQRMAALLQKSMVEIFPPDLYRNNFPNTVRGEIPADRLLPLWAAKQLTSGDSGEEFVLQRELREAVDGVLETLKPREAEILRKRFGLDGGGSATLDEVAAETKSRFGPGHVQRERIRQIEAHALRELRHPKRARKLRKFLESYTGTVSIPEPPDLGDL